MELRFLSRYQKLRILLLHFALYSTIVSMGSATVVVIGDNITLSFDDIAANFALPIKSSGVCGQLYLAEPLDACLPLTNKIHSSGNSSSPFALIIRGTCSFEEKVIQAQKAGFKAVIVYDDEDGGGLVAMAGNSDGIKIHAVFVSKASGVKLSKYAVQENMELWIIPSFENSAWSIMVISFISLLAMSAVLATCFFVRRHRIRRERSTQQAREFHGMSGRLVKAIPSLIFTAVTEDNSTSATCAICLEDYKIGEKIRVLPCKHKFHAMCVDCWLTSWRTFCPVCKKDARTSTGIPPSESTPLLSSTPSSVASSPVSIRSSLRSSSAVQIASPSPQSRSSTINYSFVNSPHHLPRPNWTHHSLSHVTPVSSMTMSRSSVDLQNTSSQRSTSYLILPSPHGSSLGYPVSPLNPRYMSPYNPSPAQRTSSYLGLGSASASQPPNPLHYSESATSFSPYCSAQSLPDC